MHRLLALLCWVALLALVSCQRGQIDADTCFHFEGDGFLNFAPSNFNNDDEIHYTLKFRTSAENGVILFCRGLTGDYESLYVRDGKLHYLLFNTSPTGIERSSGAYFSSEETVNIGQWVSVDLFRSLRQRTSRRGRVLYRTGFNVTLPNGGTVTYADNRRRHGISLSSTVSIGGFRESLSDTVGNFEGDIKDIRELKNDKRFVEPVLNDGGRVENFCLEDEDLPDPV